MGAEHLGLYDSAARVITYFELPTSTGTTWRVVAGWDPSALLAPASFPVTEKVSYNTVITGFKASLSHSRTLTSSGCLGLPASVPGVAVPPVSALKVEWASSKNGPWHTLTRTISKGGPCGHNGARFSGKATSQQGYAYYRVYFPGVPVDPRKLAGYNASASPVAYLKRP